MAVSAISMIIDDGCVQTVLPVKILMTVIAGIPVLILKELMKVLMFL